MPTIGPDLGLKEKEEKRTKITKKKKMVLPSLVWEGKEEKITKESTKHGKKQFEHFPHTFPY